VAKVGRVLIDSFSVSLEDLFCQQSAGGKILGEEMDEASILAKNLPFLSTELLRELKELQVSRRFLHFRVSAHYRGSIIIQGPPFGEPSLRMRLIAPRLVGRQQPFEILDNLEWSEIFLSLVAMR
jgi:hypothetical protein